MISLERTIEVISNKNIPPTLATYLLLLAIICLIFSSMLSISGFKQKLGAYLLRILIVPTTFIFHFSSFQAKSGLMKAGTIGGLVLGLNNLYSHSLKELFNN